MKLCDICGLKEAIDAREVRTEAYTVLIPQAVHVAKRIEGVHPQKGTPAEIFENVDACPACIGDILNSGEVLERV